MKKTYTILLSMILILPALHLLSQPIKAYKIQKPVYFDVSGKLSEIEPIELGVIKRNWKERIIPNNFSYHEQFIKETEEGSRSHEEK